MKKRVISVALVMVLVMSMCVPVFAVSARANRISSPTIYFSGGRAYCSVTITAAYQDIDATLQLWRGSNLVASWSESGTSFVGIDESHAVTSGRTYSVTVTGTIDGVPFSESSGSVTCP